MKHSHSVFLSYVLVFTLNASAIVGALGFSIIPVMASVPPYQENGYFLDLIDEARNFVPENRLSDFDTYTQAMVDNFNSWFIYVVVDRTNNRYMFCSYSFSNSNYGLIWWYDNYSQLNCQNGIWYAQYRFYLSGGGIGVNNSFSGYQLSGYFNWSNCSTFPNPDYLTGNNWLCYFNKNLSRYNGSGFENSWQANLVNEHYVPPAPPVIDFQWFKFQLGQRWYVTTYDQSLISNLETGDDTYWVWYIQEFPFDFLETEDYQRLYIFWRDIQVLPGAQNFISQSLTNLGASGVLAFDITDLILSGEFEFLGQSKFYQILDGPSGPSVGDLMAQSNDYIDLVLTPDEQNESQNSAWEEISDYTENYPSVTISPQELAQQVLGTRAYTGSMGVIQMPYPVYAWSRDHYPDDVSNEDNGNLNIDGYWHFRIDGTGIDSYSYSMINWSICNACIIPAPKDTWLNNQLGIDSYAFPVYYWNASDQLISDATFLGTFPVEYIFDMFDIVIFAPDDAVYLADFDSTLHSPGTIGFCNLNYDTTIGPANGSAKQTVFICSTEKVLYKSQLFVFCDSQSKLYDLLSQYIDKRDKWDDSFLKWSLSIFWELETINGHLSSIDTTISKWNFKDWFQDLSDKLSQIADNTSETQDPMWYESLWNWVRKFTPSDNAFTNGLNAIETGLDNIPDIALPTHFPDYPLLPTFTPTPVPIEGS